MNERTSPQTHNQFDAIIIGSGVGGLSAAICLSRAGKKVLVLEQHDVPGGWCHSFYLNGFRFTPGVHYVGLLQEGGSTTELYKGLGIANDLVFFKMNSAGYEHVHIGEERFDIPADFDEFVANLSEKFPHERKNIEKYLKLVKKVSEELQLMPHVSGFWEHLTIPFRTKNMGKYGLFSLERVIGWFIKDPLLKAILNVQFGDHGLPPAKASFPLHCAVMDHYFHGGYYPYGGGGALVKAMTNAIKKNGGTIGTSQAVKNIIVEGTKRKTAIGVLLQNGEEIYAKQIISNADPGTTYTNLVGEENLSKRLRKKLAKTKYSCTSLMLFLTVDMDLRKEGMDSGNVWMMPDTDYDSLYNQMMSPDLDGEEAFPCMFISFTTLKDPASFDGRHHTIEAITYINYEAFEKYKNEEEQRSADYLNYKSRLSQRMVKTLEKVLPGISEHIIHQDLGTPITNEFYINSTNGCVYGTEKTLNQIGPFAFKPKSEIKNLYLCGASITSHGVAGAGYSGVQTAGEILGLKQAELLKGNEDQTIRIYDAEDENCFPKWMQDKMEVKRKKLGIKSDF